jgi:hypothetical protein
MIQKTELNKRKRKTRTDAGLVEVRVWVKPENVAEVKKLDETPK